MVSMSSRTDPLRFLIRAKPGARATRVGGRWGADDAIVVAVNAPAEDNKANRAIIAALAAALDVRKGDLRIVVSRTGRSKLIEWSDPPRDADRRLAALREA
jgi:uncharacterized protein YggU (UPF0235/DUF167 family)